MSKEEFEAFKIWYKRAKPDIPFIKHPNFVIEWKETEDYKRKFKKNDR